MKSLQEHLANVGVETPLKNREASDDTKRAVIAEHVSSIMYVLGLDLSDDSLKDTPRRVAKMYVNEIFSGLNYDNFPRITTIENKMRLNEMVKVTGIDVSSTCEHHLITIDGTARVAYIPKNKILGLSKINRIVDFFARRPQVQERLTKQIAEALKFILETDDVAVQITAKHFCVKARGIKDTGSETTTTALAGAFMNIPATRSEFYAN